MPSSCYAVLGSFPLILGCPDSSLAFAADMDRSPDILVALPAVLEHLPLGDALQLSRTCKSLRAAVAAALRPRPVRALVLASASDKLLLVNPLTGRLLREAQASVPGPAADGQNAEEVGVGRESWPPCVEVDVVGNRCFVSQYEGSCVLEFSLPQLQLQRCFTSRQLAGQVVGAALSEPEGLVLAHDVIYVAWLASMTVSATPLEMLPAPPAGLAGCAPATALSQLFNGEPRQQGQQQQDDAQPDEQHRQPPQQRSWRRQAQLRRPPGRADWVFWGMRVGPDNALYVSCNPPYLSAPEGGYGDLPQETGRGLIARLALGEQGQLRYNMAAFTLGNLLSRPSGLCFDDAGGLYVTHMGCQVIKYRGPNQGEAAGKPVGVFIDCLLPQHRLTSDPQAFRPCPFDICFHEGLFFLTTHTARDEGPSHGCLSVWDRQGQLVAAHQLGEACRHPNGMALFSDPCC